MSDSERTAPRYPAPPVTRTFIDPLDCREKQPAAQDRGVMVCRTPQRIQMKPPGGDAAITAIPDHIFVTGL
jgi:hypothetical protein